MQRIPRYGPPPVFESDEQVQAPVAAAAEQRTRNPLRPATLHEMVGQHHLRALLARVIGASKANGRPLSHTLLVGASGTGKSTIAHVVANELGVNVFQVEAPVSHETLLMLRTTMVDGDVLFIDEALDLGTPLPTPTGWALLGDVQVGDQLLGAKGNPVTVTGLTPIRHERPCYRVTLVDGTSIVADADHKWLSAPQVRGGSHYLAARVVTTQEMAQSGRSWRIPNPKPVELPEADLPMDPYILGQWLGNGNRNQVYINVRPQLAEPLLARAQRSYADAAIVGETSRGSLKRLRLGEGHGGRWGSDRCAARVALEAMGIFSDKRIPGEYLRASQAQRLDLVRGLMDSDGHLDDSGFATFSNTNLSLVEGVAEILRTLGYMPRVRPTKANALARKPGWKVQFRPTPDRNPFLLRDAERVVTRRHKDERRIASIDLVPSVPVRCIAVDADDHLFLAGQGMVPTHNCHQQAIQERRGKSSATQPEVLFGLMEDRTIVSGTGVLPYPTITVIAATTDEGALPDAFINRFPLRPTIDPYTAEDLTFMAHANAFALRVRIDDDAAAAFAQACRGIPRMVNNYVRNGLDLTVNGVIDERLAHEVVRDLNATTPDGLTRDMQNALTYIYSNGRQENKEGEVAFKASVGSIATGIGKSRDQKAIQLRVEPYLIERGYLQVGHGGRRLTDSGIARAVELLTNQ